MQSVFTATEIEEEPPEFRKAVFDGAIGGVDHHMFASPGFGPPITNLLP